MHPQLELLLEIQDVRTQRGGLADGTLTGVRNSRVESCEQCGRFLYHLD